MLVCKCNTDVRRYAVRKVEGFDQGNLRSNRGRSEMSWMEGVKNYMKKLGIQKRITLDRKA